MYSLLTPLTLLSMMSQTLFTLPELSLCHQTFQTVNDQISACTWDQLNSSVYFPPGLQSCLIAFTWWGKKIHLPKLYILTTGGLCSLVVHSVFKCHRFYNILKGFLSSLLGWQHWIQTPGQLLDTVTFNCGISLLSNRTGTLDVYVREQ